MELDLTPLKRFSKSENTFRLTKIGSKRANSMVDVSQFEEGEFILIEFAITEKHPNPQAGAMIVSKGFHGGFIRTSPIVKITEFTDISTTFETEGGVYKLEKV